MKSFTRLLALIFPAAELAFAANEAVAEADLLSVANETRPDATGWVLLAPYGDWDNTVGLQRFQRSDAENVVNEFKRLANLPTRLMGLPWYIGHPDHAQFKDRYRDTRAYGRIKELKATDEGLAANVKWSGEGKALIESEAFHGHSVNWAMRRDGAVWRPLRLKSVGFTNEPNIPVPPVTAANEQNSDTMKKDQIIAWLKAQGIEVANEATDEQLTAALAKVGERVTTAVNETATATAKVAELTGQLTAANTKAVTAETNFANERKARIAPLLDAAITAGRLTAAERPALEVEFANEFDATLTKLNGLKPKLHTAASVRSNGLGTRNAKSRSHIEQIETAVNERMAKDKCDRTEAFIRLRRDRNPLFIDFVQTSK